MACNNIPPNTFKLEGFVENAEDSDKMILYYDILQNNEWHEIADTAKIINGKFQFEGKIDDITAAELVFAGCAVVIDVRLYLEPTTMKLRINKSQPYAYELSGTKVEKENIELRKDLEPNEKIYYDGLERMNDLLKQMRINADNNNISVLDSLMNLFEYPKDHFVIAKSKMNRNYFNFILKHNTYRIAPDLLYLISKSGTFFVDTLQNIYNYLPNRSKTSLMGKRALKQIEYLESNKDAEEVIKEDTLIGSLAPCFTRKDFTGETIRLSDFKNRKFVLLDFWASWCIPCIAKIPEIKDLYNKYSEKGLTIISISLDKDKDSWLNAINKYHLKAWPQILSVEDKNNSVSMTDDISLLYNVGPIPHFILIDKQGKISASWSYLDEEQLNEIDRLLKK